MSLRSIQVMFCHKQFNDSWKGDWRDPGSLRRSRILSIEQSALMNMKSLIKLFMAISLCKISSYTRKIKLRKMQLWYCYSYVPMPYQTRLQSPMLQSQAFDMASVRKNSNTRVASSLTLSFLYSIRLLLNDPGSLQSPFHESVSRFVYPSAKYQAIQELEGPKLEVAKSDAPKPGV
jgi:hypothetical protein